MTLNVPGGTPSARQPTTDLAMIFSHRGVWYALLLGLFVASAGYLCWNATGRPVEWWTSSEEEIPDQEVRRRESLEAWRAELFSTWKVKDQIARDLIARQLTFREAVARFREVDGKKLDPEIYARSLRLSFPGASMEEQLCRKLIRHALELVGNKPEEEAALRERLETELEEYLQEGSTRARGGG
jgi:hypothetical protein